MQNYFFLYNGKLYTSLAQAHDFGSGFVSMLGNPWWSERSNTMAAQGLQLRRASSPWLSAPRSFRVMLECSAFFSFSVDQRGCVTTGFVIAGFVAKQVCARCFPQLALQFVSLMESCAACNAATTTSSSSKSSSTPVFDVQFKRS